VREILERHAHERASRILDALVTRVRAFADSPLDDLTVLVLKQLANPPPAAP
jgi:serine phosphatase RsbU (regulator of sigma subunit)